MNRISNSQQAVPVDWLENDEPLAAPIETSSAPALESRLFRGGWSHLEKLALNEARGIAWATDYPQLVYPLLAEEKLAELERWQSRQRSVWNQSFELAFAA